jgi:hypothetical protein
LLDGREFECVSKLEQIKASIIFDDRRYWLLLIINDLRR